MNIFFLDQRAKQAGWFLCDQHLRKSIVEYAQILSTVNHIYAENNKVDVHTLTKIKSVLYKPTHVNHPCCIWAGKTLNNYVWLRNCLNDCLYEYKRRFDKDHKTENVVICLNKLKPGDAVLCDDIEFINLTPYHMFSENNDEIVWAYRKYYKDKFIEWKTRTDKKQIVMSWTNTTPPDWFFEI